MLQKLSEKLRRNNLGVYKMNNVIAEKKKMHINVARIKREKHVFEVIIDSEKALEYRIGKNIPLEDVLKSDGIFSDARKGLHVSEKDMLEVFGTDDENQVIKKILKDGEIQLTAEYKQKLKEEKLKYIVNVIHSNGVDPRTHAPHPVARIEAAIEQAKIHIDENKSAQDQVADVLKKLKVILPIKFETKEIQVIIGPKYAPKCYSTVKGFGTTLKDEYLADGSWLVVMEISSSMEADFYEKLNAITHGSAECKLLKTK